jgi:hypothetical protein
VRARLKELRNDWLRPWRPAIALGEHDRIGAVDPSWYAPPHLVRIDTNGAGAAAAGVAPAIPQADSSSSGSAWYDRLRASMAAIGIRGGGAGAAAAPAASAPAASTASAGVGGHHHPGLGSDANPSAAGGAAAPSAGAYYSQQQQQQQQQGPTLVTGMPPGRRPEDDDEPAASPVASATGDSGDGCCSRARRCCVRACDAVGCAFCCGPVVLVWIVMAAATCASRCSRSASRCCCRLSRQPLDRIASYFGETIAFYFAFLEFYNHWLVAPACAGALLFMGQLYYGAIDIACVWR